MPAKIYSREFSEHQNNPLVVEDSVDDVCFVLGFPHEFSISRVILQQVGGGDRVGTFDIYDAPPCALDEVGDGSESIAAVPNPNLHKVIPTQSYAGGVPTELFAASEGGKGWEYANRENTFTDPRKRIFVRIQRASGSTDQATFDLIIAGQPAVGR